MLKDPVKLKNVSPKHLKNMLKQGSFLRRLNIFKYSEVS